MDADLTPWQTGSDVLAGLPAWQQLTASWLWSYRESADTRNAYQRDVADWVAWCQRDDVDPMGVTEPVATRYAAQLANQPRPGTGRPLDADSVRRRLSALTSWYDYLARHRACVVPNPFTHVRRPKTDVDYLATPGLSEAELVALVGTTPERSVQRAVVWFLAETGCRVSEACNLDVEHLRTAGGDHVATLDMKGQKRRDRPLSASLWDELAAQIGTRTSGPVFLGTRSRRRITRHQVWRIVTTAAGAAGGPVVSPHGLRRTAITIAGQRGVPLEDRQYAAGHADPRTTQRYDRAARSLDNDPARTMAQVLGPRLQPPPRTDC